MDSAATDGAMVPVADEDFTSTVLPDKAVLRPDSLSALCDLDEGYHQAHFCRPFCNWVLPGRLMVGTNPMWGFMTSPRERMSRILDEGITVFYALQREVPPQESMGDRGGSHDRATGLADETPYRPLALAMAQEKGISAPLLFRRFGIQDMGIPEDPSDALPVVAELQQMLQDGKQVYLHCRGGVGRAGTIAACLLVYMYDISAEAALERIQKAYDTRGGLGISPETEEQKDFVRDFADALKGGVLQRLPVEPEPMAE